MKFFLLLQLLTMLAFGSPQQEKKKLLNEGIAHLKREQFDEEEETFKKLKILDPKHPIANSALQRIPLIKKEKDPGKRRMATQQIMMGVLGDMMSENKGLLIPMAERGREIENQSRNFAEKYKLKAIDYQPYKRTKEEISSGEAIGRLTDRRKNAEAEQLAEKRMKDFPQSPAAVSDLVTLLIRNKNYVPAKKWADYGVQKFPLSLELAVCKWNADQAIGNPSDADQVKQFGTFFGELMETEKYLSHKQKIK